MTSRNVTNADNAFGSKAASEHDEGSDRDGSADTYLPTQNNEQLLEQSLVEESEFEDNNNSDEESEPDFPVFGYAILNCLLILWGIIGLVMAFWLQRSHRVAEDFLQVRRRHWNLPPLILFGSCGLSVLSGLTALICLCCESSAFFSVYPHVNGLVIGLNCAASLCAYGGWNFPNVHWFQRLLEADTLARYGDDKSYINILGEQYLGFWDDLQRTLRCCGVDGPSNWLESVCACMPMSCCNTGKLQTCEARLQDFHDSSSSFYKNFSHIRKYLWEKNCILVVGQEMDTLKRDWISFPLILLFFHFILIFNINYTVVAVRSRYNVPAGFILINQLKHRVAHCLQRICCCCRTCCGRRRQNSIFTESVVLPQGNTVKENPGENETQTPNDRS